MNHKKEYGLRWVFKRTRSTRPQLALYILLILCVTIGQISLSYFLKAFVDVATGVDAPLLRIGGIAIAVIGAGGIVTMIASVIAKYIHGKTECSLRTELLSVILSRRMIDISAQHTGELHTKLTADTQAVSMCFPLIIEKMMGDIASALVSITTIFS